MDFWQISCAALQMVAVFTNARWYRWVPNTIHIVAVHLSVVLWCDVLWYILQLCCVLIHSSAMMCCDVLCCGTHFSCVVLWYTLQLWCVVIHTLGVMCFDTHFSSGVLWYTLQLWCVVMCCVAVHLPTGRCPPVLPRQESDPQRHQAGESIARTYGRSENCWLRLVRPRTIVKVTHHTPLWYRWAHTVRTKKWTVFVFWPSIYIYILLHLLNSSHGAVCRGLCAVFLAYGFISCL